jgi:hypothetical protein
MHIPPADIKTVKDSERLISCFIEVTVFESSEDKKSFINE